MALKRNRTPWRDDLSRIGWQRFESLLAEHYRDEGYAVEHCGTGGTGAHYDGGVDLVLRRDGETVLVQVKHWNAMQVAHNDVHQLLGLVETRGATRAILITSGEFTTAAREAGARTSRIELVDGAALRLMVDPRLVPSASPTSTPTTNDLSAWAPVAEKTVDALIDVMAGRRPGRRRRSVSEEFFRLVFGIVVMLVVLYFVRQQLEQVRVSLTPPSRPAVEARATTPSPVRPTATAAVAPPAPAQGAQRMTEEELAEWERKNRESMEILERTTPELVR